MLEVSRMESDMSLEDLLDEEYNTPDEWEHLDSEDVISGVVGRKRGEDGGWVNIAHSWSPFD